MKYKIVIEELISQEFEIEIEDGADVYETVKEKYRNEELIVDNPSLVEANMTILDEETGWIRIA